jgi:oligopeptide transport system ATP-binding protein
MTALLSLRNLHVRYPRADHTISAVRDVSLTVASDETLGIIGESGSGKTQTFMAVMGLLAAGAETSGSVRFESHEILGAQPATLNRWRGSRLSMILQDPMSALTPHLKIGVQLAEVLVSHRGWSWSRARQSALEMLQRVSLNEPERRFAQFPHELSGGMRQRVLIGMSVLCEPSLVIADEPTSALDVTVQAEIMQLFRALRRDLKMALVLISHDFGVVASLADRIAVMYAGRVVEQGRTVELLKGARHPYTDLLLRCVPRVSGARLERMTFIPGQPPDPGEVSPGCAFAPRCPRAADRCRRETPSLRRRDEVAEVACHFPLTP